MLEKIQEGYRAIVGCQVGELVVDAFTIFVYFGQYFLHSNTTYL